jgi:hypothetical protein
MPETKEMLGIRGVLQNVEDALIDNGWDEITAVTIFVRVTCDPRRCGGLRNRSGMPSAS